MSLRDEATKGGMMDASDAEVAYYVAEADRVTKQPDVAEVKEALAEFDAWGYASGGLDRYEAAVVDAARRWVRMVSESEELTWCDPHDSPLIHDTDTCDYALENEYCVTPCRADGSRLVAAVGVEKEESQ